MSYFISLAHDLDNYEEETALLDTAFYRAAELSKPEKRTSNGITMWLSTGPFLVWHYAPGKKRHEQVRRVRAFGLGGKACWAKECGSCKGSPNGWGGTCLTCHGVGYVEDAP